MPDTAEIRFYRATAAHGFLSNLYRSPVEFEGRWFHTAEHAYQFGKAVDPVVREWIISAPKPHLVAAAAHALFVFDVVPTWSQTKDERMRAVLRAKFRPRADLANWLLATGDARLIEASNMDAYWGIGKSGKGKNMLGVMLMEVREELRTGVITVHNGAVRA